MAREFNDTILVTEPVADILREVDPSSFVCRLRHDVFSLSVGKNKNIPVNIVDFPSILGHPVRPIFKLIYCLSCTDRFEQRMFQEVSVQDMQIYRVSISSLFL